VSKSLYATSLRTHACGDLRKFHKGEAVTVCGAIDRVVDDRTYEVRDAYGKVLVRRAPGAGDEDFAAWRIQRPSPETIVRAKGTVDLRKPPDPSNPTGEVMVQATGFELLAYAKEPLLFDFRDEKVPRKERIRHRYLYLRKPAVHETFAFRTKVVAALRRFLVSRGFEEVETPILANRWTPEARESWLAIRDREQVFALPGARPIHGTLLMASGFDRVFEVARRFRRKATYGPMEQPEYDVLDVTAAYVDEADLLRLEDDIVAHVLKECGGGASPSSVRAAAYEEALVRYGTDAPDARYGLEFQDLTELGRASRVPDVREPLHGGGALRAVLVRRGAEVVKDREIAELAKLATGRSETAALFWITVADDATFSDTGTIPSDRIVAREIVKRLKAEPGDLAIAALDRDRTALGALTAELRPRLARACGLLDRRPGGAGPGHAFFRVTRLPYFRPDPATGEPVLAGDPLVRPVAEELEAEVEPAKLHGYAHSLVLDGVEVGGGAIRNHDRQFQNRLLQSFGIAAEDADRRFGQLLHALRYGVPPHGRIAIGIDRLVALLRGLPSLDEVIALPKTDEGLDPLTRSPWPIDNALVRSVLGL